MDGTSADGSTPPWTAWRLLASLLALVTYPTAYLSPSSATAANGLDETGLLAAVRSLALSGPNPGGSIARDGAGRLSQRDYHGVRRGPFAVQRAAMALFASLLERRRGLTAIADDRHGVNALDRWSDVRKR